jgi:hypothetical protein
VAQSFLARTELTCNFVPGRFHSYKKFTVSATVIYGTRVTVLRVSDLWFVMLLYHPSYSIFHKYPDKKKELRC